MTILVVAAHPDDEVLGCGGMMARRISEGHEVHVLLMAEGALARGPDWQEYMVELKEKTKIIAQLLKISSYSVAGFPDQQMDSVPLLTLVRCIEAHIERLKPSVVYTHWSGDLNRDHRLTFEAVMTACRPQPDAPVKEIYSFEIPSATGWGETQFQPNVYMDITGFGLKKYDALQVYRAELRPAPHARSERGIYALQQYRGCQAGVEMAEAFLLVRKVEV